MKKYLLLIAICIASVSSFAQIGSGLQYKAGLKKMEFKKVSYVVYGDTINSVRLSDKSAHNLKATKVDQLNKLGTKISTVEKELNKVRTKLIEFDYPLRTMADDYITTLASLENLDEIDSYKNEIAAYKSLYNSKVKEMKSNGQLDSLMYAKERHGR
ncbi:hypothetical protein [Carboxylicivirga linearis]|uniref:DUF4142 domain-containing protein n=1 Tax=Carboxylicivirga linearis TaxID=1628157 RepID=A0ABS5K0P0_9BACT|nr:hypothetical protein [Carboxylicivirga linearis]MBS2100694.1 hypothetical protein [Carboxylicivirga linearis]